MNPLLFEALAYITPAVLVLFLSVFMQSGKARFVMVFGATLILVTYCISSFLIIDCFRLPAEIGEGCGTVSSYSRQKMRTLSLLLLVIYPFIAPFLFIFALGLEWQTRKVLWKSKTL